MSALNLLPVARQWSNASRHNSRPFSTVEISAPRLLRIWFRILSRHQHWLLVWSRNDKDFKARYPAIAQALTAIPDETVIDGEIVALESGRPSFNALQNYETATLIYYVFDVMILAAKDVMNEPLGVRRQLLQKNVPAKLGELIRESPPPIS